MSDTHHTWNTAKPIRTRKQVCGCHITAKRFNLCTRGRDFKKAADGCYGLWMHNKDSEVDPADIRAMRESFEIAASCYLTHIRTGKDWCIG